MKWVTKYEAPWCAPCKVAQHDLDKLVEAGLITLTRIDVSVDPQLARENGVRSVPTIHVFGDNTDGYPEGIFNFTTKEFHDLVNVKQD